MRGQTSQDLATTGYIRHIDFQLTVSNDVIQAGTVVVVVVHAVTNPTAMSSASSHISSHFKHLVLPNGQ